jgi:hypothetical protein
MRSTSAARRRSEMSVNTTSQNGRPSSPTETVIDSSHHTEVPSARRMAHWGTR